MSFHYIARWYDPAVAHFTQADMIVPNAGDSAAYDRYAYVKNNPVKYTDPSGHRISCGDGGVGTCGGMPKARYYWGSWYGMYADYRGLDTSKQIVKSGNIVTAAAIAVQSQYYYKQVDKTVATINKKLGGSSGEGPAQIRREKGIDPYNDADAIKGIEKRMQTLADACKGCDATDLLIARMIGQNGGVSPQDVILWSKEKPRESNGNVDWSGYNKSRKPLVGIAGIINNDRAKDYPHYDVRFMARLMYLDMLELQNQGWEIPPDIDWARINYFVNGE